MPLSDLQVRVASIVLAIPDEIERRLVLGQLVHDRSTPDAEAPGYAISGRLLARLRLL